MQENSHYDIIIAGAGAAGLSLAWNIAKEPGLSDKQILILDQSLSHDKPKTWCFWDEDYLSFPDIIQHTWKSLSFSAFKNLYVSPLLRYSYKCIRSADFHHLMIGELKKSPDITFLETGITGFDSHQINTEKGTFTGDIIFQSVLKPGSETGPEPDYKLSQHFSGWDIETNTDVFDPDTALLMDFDVSEKNEVAFMYLLPVSKRKALIEYTYFSEIPKTEDHYDAGIRQYISEKLELEREDYTITGRESGIIPMENRKYPAWYCEGVMNIGTVGGLTKPTTGYTFTRILKHSAQITKALAKSEPLPEIEHSKLRFRIYDLMLLHILKYHPKTGVRVFHELFKRNSFDLILHFLDEKTNIFQEIKLFSTLPYMPFLRALWSIRKRLSTGY